MTKGVESSMPLKILLLGNSGVGKSTLGDLILQSDFFVTSEGPGAQSTVVKESLPFTFEGRQYVVVDTPGFPDTNDEKVPFP